MAWRPTQLTREQMEERRLAAGRLLRAGRLSQAAIAREVGVSRASVTRWKHRVACGGVRSLRRRRAPGAGAGVVAGGGPVAAAPARAGARGAAGRLRHRAVDAPANRRRHRAGVFRRVPPALAGPRAARPRLESAAARGAGARAGRRARGGVAAARLATRKKGARRSRRAVAFVDETGHSFRARPGRSWAPRGRPPVLRRLTRQHGRREVSSIVALVAPRTRTDRPRLYARHFRGAIGGAQVAQALRYFRRRVGLPLTVVWDRLNAHRAKPVRTLVAAHPADYRLEWLPPYAPDLNPEELCNGAVKRATRNAAPESVDALHRLARDAFRRLGRNPNTLAGFLRHERVRVTQPT